MPGLSDNELEDMTQKANKGDADAAFICVVLVVGCFKNEKSYLSTYPDWPRDTG